MEPFDVIAYKDTLDTQIENMGNEILRKGENRGIQNYRIHDRFKHLSEGIKPEVALITARDLTDQLSLSRCPCCKKTPKSLDWLPFTSPEWTWPALCGREGYFVACKDCSILIGSVVTCLS